MKNIDMHDNSDLMDDKSLDTLIADAFVRRETLARIECNVAAEVRRMRRRRMAVMWLRVLAFAFGTPVLVAACGFCIRYMLTAMPHTPFIYIGTAMFAVSGMFATERLVAAFSPFDSREL